MTGAEGEISTFDHREFPADRLADLKGDHRVAVCIPARDEERTVARVVAAVRYELVERTRIVDELVVIDDGSLDATAAVAERAGARVVPSTEGRCAARPAAIGKGGAMRRGVEVTTGDLVVFLDADVVNLRDHFVTGLLGPLLVRPDLVLVKGCYTRAYRGDPSGGGRVTELVARPAISLLFPSLAALSQPLAGETAVRRSVVEELELAEGYGVEMGLLLDVAGRHGAGAIAQVDLGVRVHRNRPLAELAPQAREVLAVALGRSRIPVT
ncbi:MAG TPA: glucosyl-3-phosphoglycerate synthase [Acidimicrobiales bacterium]|nr:glucosyl-3-phosphoglycerate synthase [Acidimicrobiales bacterium]